MIISKDQFKNITGMQVKHIDGDKLNVTTALIQAMSSDRQEQKERFRRVTDFYYGRYIPHYDAIFDNIFSDFENKKERMNFEHSFFTRAVVDQMALIYRQKPIRKFFKGDKEITDEKTLDYYNQVFKWLSNEKDQTFNKMVKANGTCLYKIVFRNGKIEGDVFTPDLYDVVQDPKDMTEAISLIYEVASNDSMNLMQQNGTKFIYWSDDEFKVVWLEQQKNDSKVVTSYPVGISESPYGNNEDTKNPYGVIPAVKVTETQLLADYFDDENANIFDNSDRALTLKKTAKGNTYLFQGFDILTLTTSDPDKYESFTVSAADVIRLDKGNPNESDDTLAFLSPSDKLTNLDDSYKKEYISNALALGLEVGEGNATSNTSGVSIALSKDSQNKIINADRSKYEKFETDRWEIIKKVNNYHFRDSKLIQKIDEDVRLEVEFEPIKIDLGTDEKVTLNEFKLNNGLITRFDLIKEDKPNWSDSEITDYIAKIDSERSLILLDDEETPIENPE